MLTRESPHDKRYFTRTRRTCFNKFPCRTAHVLEVTRRTNRRQIDSNRIERDRHAISGCAFAWSRPIYLGLSALLVSSVRQYFTTINYYGRIDLTPNANTQITASLFRHLSPSLDPVCIVSLCYPPALVISLLSIALHADAPMYFGRLCRMKGTPLNRF